MELPYFIFILLIGILFSSNKYFEVFSKTFVFPRSESSSMYLNSVIKLFNDKSKPIELYLKFSNLLSMAIRHT